MARPLTAALVVAVLAVSGARGATEQTPKRGGTVVVAWGHSTPDPACVLPTARCPLGLVQTPPATLVLPEMLEAGHVDG